MEVARGELVEKDLDAMIERRSRQVNPDEQEALWQESVRRYTARRREEMRADWHGWHLEQADRHRRTLKALIVRHEEQAAKLIDVLELQRKD